MVVNYNGGNTPGIMSMENIHMMEFRRVVFDAMLDFNEV
jgi:hypothetical protein